MPGHLNEILVYGFVTFSSVWGRPAWIATRIAVVSMFSTNQLQFLMEAQKSVHEKLFFVHPVYLFPLKPSRRTNPFQNCESATPD
jgi:hypothetical protein